MPTPRKSNLSARNCDKIRRAIALLCLATVFEKGSMKKEQQHAAMFDLYHGKKGSTTVSHLDQFIRAEGYFESCWQLDPAYAEYTLQLKKHLRCERIMIQGKDITHKMLESKYLKTNNEPVLGRSLIDAARLALRNSKKAKSCADGYLDEGGNVKESGKTEEDVYEWVLNDMWELLYKKDTGDISEPPIKKLKTDEEDIDISSSCEPTNTPPLAQPSQQVPPQLPISSDTDSDDAEVAVSNVMTNTTRPSDWIFPGFMAFILFGPFKENRDAGRFLDFMIKDDPPKKDAKKYNRETSRKTKAKAETFKRERDANRGRSTLDTLLIKTQDHQRVMAHQAGLEAILMSLNLQADRTQREMSNTLNAAANNAFAAARYEKLTAQLDAVNSEIELYEKEMQLVLANNKMNNNSTTS